MRNFPKNVLIFLFFSTFIFSEEDKNLKEIFSEHYLGLASMSEEMIYYKFIFLIKSLKNKIFCDSLGEGDEKNLIQRSELSKNKYFYLREKLVRKMDKNGEEYKYGVGLGGELITAVSNYVPEKNLERVFIIKKTSFLNCEGEKLDKFELSKKFCAEFEFEYYIFSDEDQIDRDFCFRLFSFYDEDGRGSAYFPKRRIKFFGVSVKQPE